MKDSCFIIKTSLMLLILTGILSIILIQDISAEIYKYKDKNGMECFTDSLQSVPEEYREKAVIIQGRSKEEGKQIEINPPEQKDTYPATASTTERIKRTIKGFVSNRWVKLITGIVGFLVIFIVVGKAGKAVGYKKVVSISRIVLICLVFLYFFYLYSKEVVTLYDKLMSKIIDTKTLLEDRNKKTREIKELEIPQR